MAKRIIVGNSIASGLGTPPSSLPAWLFAGFAFAAPAQSATLLAFLPYSLGRRTLIACAWMTFAILFLFLGNQAWADHESPTVFRASTTCALPCVALGCFLPWGALRITRGWYFRWRDNATESRRSDFSIANLLTLTLLVALCLLPLQFEANGSFRSVMIAFLIGVVFGTVLIIPIYWLMKPNRVFSIILFLTLGYTVFVGIHLLMLKLGAGGLAQFNALFMTTALMSVLFGLMLPKLAGMEFFDNSRKSKTFIK